MSTFVALLMLPLLLRELGFNQLLDLLPSDLQHAGKEIEEVGRGGGRVGREGGRGGVGREGEGGGGEGGGPRPPP